MTSSKVRGSETVTVTVYVAPAVSSLGLGVEESCAMARPSLPRAPRFLRRPMDMTYGVHVCVETLSVPVSTSPEADATLTLCTSAPEKLMTVHPLHSAAMMESVPVRALLMEPLIE